MIKNTLITFCIIFISLISFAQQIPNGNFENWTDSYNAVGWNSVNVSFANIHSAEQSTDAEEGSYSAKLISKEALGQFIPGIITLGEIDIANQTITGGIEFSERPTGISYFLKYFPEGSDTTYMLSILTKWNEATESTDTIGMTAYFTANETVDYTQVNVPYFYYSEETPDTLNVIFISSGFIGNVGSTLYVDNISMLYTDVIISPTICFSASDTTYSEFTTSFMDIPNAVSYKLDVSENNNFTSFISGYNNLDIELNTSKTVDIITPSLYYYRVRVNYGSELGLSMNSNTIAVPMPTHNLEASEVLSNSFTVNWQSAINHTNYYIDIATDTNFQNYVSGYENLQVSSNLTSLHIENLNAETEYFYRVRVEYENGNYLSKSSNTISVNTTVGINDIFSESIKTYSTKNKIFILSNYNDLPNEIVIYNIQGKEIKRVTNPKIKECLFVKNTGIYIINLRYNNFIANKKLVVNF